jgi:hypothetical protein
MVISYAEEEAVGDFSKFVMAADWGFSLLLDL